MLPTLVPHALLLVGCVAAGGLAWRAPAPASAGASRPTLLLAFAVLALGAGVAAFHAGAFFYFWMTLGLFPAVAFALALAPLRDDAAAGRAPARGRSPRRCCGPPSSSPAP